MDIADPATESMEQPSPPGPRGRRCLNSTILAGGAAVAMMLAGLGIAGARVDDAPPSEPPPAEMATAAGEHHKEDCHREGDHDGPRRQHRRHMVGFGVEIAAQAIGIPRKDLVTALRSGQSMADVARSKSVDPAKVVDALVAAATSRLQAKVEAGGITQARADERLAKQKERFETFVNRTPRAGEPTPGEDDHRRGDDHDATA